MPMNKIEHQLQNVRFLGVIFIIIFIILLFILVGNLLRYYIAYYHHGFLQESDFCRTCRRNRFSQLICQMKRKALYTPFTGPLVLKQYPINREIYFINLVQLGPAQYW